jgi:hypothetical protein
MASLNIREVDEALVKELKVGAAQAGLTLKQYVLRKLGGDGLEKKVAESAKSSVGAEPRSLAGKADGQHPRTTGRRKGPSAKRGHASPVSRASSETKTAPYPAKKTPDPDFRKKCARETCQHEKVYHKQGLCQLCDGGVTVHEFQE